MNQRIASIRYLAAAAFFAAGILGGKGLQALLGRSAGAEAGISIFTVVAFAAGTWVGWRTFQRVSAGATKSTRAKSYRPYVTAGVVIALAAFALSLYLRSRA
jgi:hypothetical protein